jgi:hypothetical protein
VSAADNLAKATKDKAQAAKNLVDGKVDAAANAVTGTTDDVANAAKGKSAAAKAAVDESTDHAASTITNATDKAATAAKDKAAAAKDLVDGKVNAAADKVNAATANVASSITGKVDASRAAADETIDAAANAINEGVRKADEAAKAAGDAVNGATDKTAAAVTKSTDSAIERAVAFVKPIKAAVSSILGKADTAIEYVVDIVKAVQQMLTCVAVKGPQIVTDIVEEGRKGITAVQRMIEEAMKGVDQANVNNVIMPDWDRVNKAKEEMRCVGKVMRDFANIFDRMTAVADGGSGPPANPGGTSPPDEAIAQGAKKAEKMSLEASSGYSFKTVTAEIQSRTVALGLQSAAVVRETSSGAQPPGRANQALDAAEAKAKALGSSETVKAMEQAGQMFVPSLDLLAAAVRLLPSLPPAAIITWEVIKHGTSSKLPVSKATVANKAYRELQKQLTGMRSSIGDFKSNLLHAEIVAPKVMSALTTVSSGIGVVDAAVAALQIAVNDMVLAPLDINQKRRRRRRLLGGEKAGTTAGSAPAPGNADIAAMLAKIEAKQDKLENTVRSEVGAVRGAVTEMGDSMSQQLDSVAANVRAMKIESSAESKLASAARMDKNRNDMRHLARPGQVLACPENFDKTPPANQKPGQRSYESKMLFQKRHNLLKEELRIPPSMTYGVAVTISIEVEVEVGMQLEWARCERRLPDLTSCNRIVSLIRSIMSDPHAKDKCIKMDKSENPTKAPKGVVPRGAGAFLRDKLKTSSLAKELIFCARGYHTMLKWTPEEKTQVIDMAMRLWRLITKNKPIATEANPEEKLGDYCKTLPSQLAVAEKLFGGNRDKSLGLKPGSTLTLIGGKGKKFCSDTAKKGVVCNRPAAEGSEIFTISSNTDGKITLKGGRGHKYCADTDRGVVCDRDSAGAWTRFTFEPKGVNKIAIKGGRSGKYCGDDDGGKVVCNLDSASASNKGATTFKYESTDKGVAQEAGRDTSLLDVGVAKGSGSSSGGSSSSSSSSGSGSGSSSGSGSTAIPKEVPHTGDVTLVVVPYMYSSVLSYAVLNLAILVVQLEGELDLELFSIHVPIHIYVNARTPMMKGATKPSPGLLIRSRPFMRTLNGKLFAKIKVFGFSYETPTIDFTGLKFFLFELCKGSGTLKKSCTVADSTFQIDEPEAMDPMERPPTTGMCTPCFLGPHKGQMSLSALLKGGATGHTSIRCFPSPIRVAQFSGLLFMPNEHANVVPLGQDDFLGVDNGNENLGNYFFEWLHSVRDNVVGRLEQAGHKYPGKDGKTNILKAELLDHLNEARTFPHYKESFPKCLHKGRSECGNGLGYKNVEMLAICDEVRRLVGGLHISG